MDSSCSKSSHVHPAYSSNIPRVLPPAYSSNMAAPVSHSSNMAASVRGRGRVPHTLNMMASVHVDGGLGRLVLVPVPANMATSVCAPSSSNDSSHETQMSTGRHARHARHAREVASLGCCFLLIVGMVVWAAS